MLEELVALEGLSPSNLSVTIQRSGLCTRDPGIWRSAKNLVYFADPQTGRFLLEPFPMQRKEVIREDASCDGNVTGIPPEYVPMKQSLPAPSFRTTD